VLQWVFRFGVKELFPGIQGFGYAVLGSLPSFLVIVAWWMFFSAHAGANGLRRSG
jgi:hypothetical protein